MNSSQVIFIVFLRVQGYTKEVEHNVLRLIKLLQVSFELCESYFLKNIGYFLEFFYLFIFFFVSFFCRFLNFAFICLKRNSRYSKYDMHERIRCQSYRIHRQYSIFLHMFLSFIYRFRIFLHSYLT